ncbi:MAG: penicillin-binding transpeptidase domain-containing protein [Steroidobacteraceae bacterium]
MAINAHRGIITDRFGEPLAVSTPVDSVWVNPRELAGNSEQLLRLARALGLDRQEFVRRVSSNLDREFLDSRLRPAAGRRAPRARARHRGRRRDARVPPLLPGRRGHRPPDRLQQRRRCRPEGRRSSPSTTGSPARTAPSASSKDNRGRKVQDVESIRAAPGARPGAGASTCGSSTWPTASSRPRSATTARAPVRWSSTSTAAKCWRSSTQPAYNPNDREQINPAVYRNRAATDLFEPGSSIKPFIVAAALGSGRYRADSVVDTGGGFLQVGAKTIEDEHPLGAVNLATVLAKSSNVGMAKIALSLEPRQIWTTLDHLGFGQVTASGFPGESAGLLSNYSHWREISIATLAYGYGLSVTPLQLAQAYATLGAYGLRRPASLLRADNPVAGERVVDPAVCRADRAARVGGDARGHRHARADRRLPRRRQDRHRPGRRRRAATRRTATWRSSAAWRRRRTRGSPP